MAPKKKFSKEQIIEAAFEIAKQEGINSISIRKVAEKMGGSIAPIYVNFNDVDELIKEVMKKIIELTQQILAEESTGNAFRDIGMASLRFAQDYSVLFRELVMNTSNSSREYENETVNYLVKEMKKDPKLKGFDDEELKTLLFKMKVFQTGLSIMVANGGLQGEFNNIEKLIVFLDEVAEDIIASMRLKKIEGERK